MPLDRAKYFTLIDKILEIFSITFGKDLLLVEKQIAIEHMGFLKMKSNIKRGTKKESTLQKDKKLDGIHGR